jgi:hypothetical protein
MTTIVSAFITNINNRQEITTEDYIEHGIKLLSVNVFKIVFIDYLIFDRFSNYSNENTYLVSVKKMDNYLYNHHSLITNSVNTLNTTKDTIEYMFTICHKTEWIRQSILMNVFKTDQFIWIDFGIYRIYRNLSDNDFINIIKNMTKHKYENIRIASIWKTNVDFNVDIYKTVAWYFAGGVFGGNSDVLIHFAELMKQKCIEIIKDKNTIMWEVNIWYLLYKSNPSMFDCYLCDHDVSILINY